VPEAVVQSSHVSVGSPLDVNRFPTWPVKKSLLSSTPLSFRLGGYHITPLSKPATVSVKGKPSGRIQPRAEPRGENSDAVVVPRKAAKCPGTPAAAARESQNTAAPARPPKAPLCV
jgi:hypothetical protein